MIYEKVAAILAEHADLDVNEITEESSFEDLGLDSLDTVELVMKLEEEFEIELDTDESIKTVQDLVKSIQAKVKD